MRPEPQREKRPFLSIHELESVNGTFGQCSSAMLWPDRLEIPLRGDALSVDRSHLENDIALNGSLVANHQRSNPENSNGRLPHSVLAIAEWYLDSNKTHSSISIGVTFQ